MKILIGGDICPIGGNAPFFRSGDAASLFHDLLEDFAGADLVVANLECPLIDTPTPIEKTGPVFGEDASAINGIRAAGIDVLGLANNHILDHGREGLERTLAACADAGIATVGAGRQLGDARAILVRRVGNVRVGILAMAEHEFSVATATTAGANPLDVVDYVRNVAAHRESFDHLIVLLHGGAEFLTAPSPRLKDTCHFLVEMGAAAVVVQHPHSFGGYETYRGGHIVYGQGALVMDEALYRDVREFHEGVLVELTLANGSTTMRLIPFTQSVPVPGARRMPSPAADVFLRELSRKAESILDDEYVRQEWHRFCRDQQHEYISVLLAHSRMLRVANRRGQLARVLYDGRRLLGTRNVVTCETHREALETIFTELMA